jgi:hypothetical protein
MADEPKDASIDPTIVTSPEPKSAPSPEATLYPDTPAGEQPTDAAAKGAEASKADEEKTQSGDVKPEKTEGEPKPPTEETKPEPEKGQAKPQTDYDFALPKDSPLTKDDLESFQKEWKEAGLTKEKAESALLEKDQLARTVTARAQAAFETRQKTELQASKSAWKVQTEKDPELGGEHLSETVLLSSRAARLICTAEDQKFLEDSGLGNHPSVVRMFVKMGKILGEDTLVRGDVGDVPKTQKSREEILYGKTTPNK